MNTSGEILFWSGELAKLKGAKIIRGVVDNSDPYENDPLFGLLLLLPDKTKHTIWFLSDEEGNGGGRFAIVPPVEKVTELRSKLIQGN